MKLKYVVVLSLVLFGILVNAQAIPMATVEACSCSDELSGIRLQNTITETNLKLTMAMYMNQTSSKFDAQQIMFESKMTAMEQRMVEHIEAKITQETDPLKFIMAGIFAGLGLAGTVMALYIALGG